MRIKAPHPVFIICSVAVLACLFVAVVEAVFSSHCRGPDDQGSSETCTMKNQVKVDASITYTLAGLAFAIVGVGFQFSTREPDLASPPRAPFPAAGGPPWYGNVPPGPTPIPPPHGPPPGQG